MSDLAGRVTAMDISPYVQNLPVKEVTVLFPGEKSHQLVGTLVAHDADGIVIEDHVDLNFIPWSAVGALMVNKASAAVPAPVNKVNSVDESL